MTSKKTINSSHIETLLSCPFVHHVRGRCEKFRINFSLSLTSDCLCLSDGDTTDGFFDPPTRHSPGILCLSVAGKELSEIYHTLAHEFCHLEQWVRDDALWVKWMKRSSRKSTIALEKLTEEEALEMLKKWDLFDDSMEIRKTKYLRRLENL
jgi:hypothetical protein